MTRSICVFCSSSDDIHRAYFDAAETLGRQIGGRGGQLVYGGGRIGLMGAVARATHAAGGSVVGVIPESMKQVEVAYTEADELIVTETMRQRKQIMEDRAEAFVVLPGGLGTLEELLEILTLRSLRYTHKPVVLLNTEGFFDHFVELVDRLYDEGFARKKNFELFAVANDPGEVFELLDSHADPAAASA